MAVVWFKISARFAIVADKRRAVGREKKFPFRSVTGECGIGVRECRIEFMR
jgi:hypothetical protein